jgi:hypothetical protein
MAIRWMAKKRSKLFSIKKRPAWRGAFSFTSFKEHLGGLKTSEVGGRGKERDNGSQPKSKTSCKGMSFYEYRGLIACFLQNRQGFLK